MSNLAVYTTFKGRDETSRVFKRMSKQAQTFGRKSKGAFGKASKGAAGFGATLKGVLGAGLITSAVSKLQQGLATVGREFVDFDQSITSASAKFPGKIQRGTDAFKEMGRVAREVGGNTQFTAAEAASGLEFLAMAGFSAAEAMESLPVVTDLATASNTDLARAIDIASDAVGAFKPVLGAYGGAQGKITKIGDVFAATVTSANVTLEDMFETMKEGGPVSSAAGASIETFAALTGKLGSAGIKGSKAGTTLKRMFLQLQKVKKPFIKLSNGARLALEQENGELRDITRVLDDFAVATKDMGGRQRDSALASIFGARAIAGANVLLAEGGEELRRYRTELENSDGAQREMATSMRKGLGNQLKALQSSAIELGFKIFEAFAGKGEEGIKKFTEAIRKFDVKPVVKALKEVYDIVSKVLGFLWDNRGMIKAFAALLVGIKAISIAMTAFNVIAAMNPVGAIVAGLIVAIGLIDTYFDKVKAKRREERQEKFGPMLTSHIKKAKELNNVLAATASMDLDKQLAVREDMRRQIASIAMMKAQIGETNDEERKAVYGLKKELIEIAALQARIKEQGGAVPFIDDLNLKTVDYGGGATAPNADAAANAQEFLDRSKIDITVNNALPGTTVDAKSEGRAAPRVNQNLAYNN